MHLHAKVPVMIMLMVEPDLHSLVCVGMINYKLYVHVHEHNIRSCIYS